MISLYPSLDFSVVFCQIVNLKRNGQIQKLSKREGNIFELNLLIEEIGIDNFRYFMCYRKNDTHMDLDIDLIKKENKENPIYYIQYSYARSQSVLDRKKNIITSNVDFSKELKNLYSKKSISFLELIDLQIAYIKKTEKNISNCCPYGISYFRRYSFTRSGTGNSSANHYCFICWLCLSPEEDQQLTGQTAAK